MKPKSILYSRAYMLTYLTEFTVIVAGVLVYKLADEILGKNGFNEYSLCRRTISFIHPMLIVGLGVGLPRYVAFADKENNPGRAMTYLYATLLIYGLIALLVFPCMYFFSRGVASLLFDDARYAYLVPVLIYMLGSMILHSAVYGYFRGALLMSRANLLQFLNLGIIPVTAFLCSDNISEVLWITGTAWYATSMIFFLTLVNTRAQTEHLRHSLKELFFYGVLRVPGDVAIAGLFSLPAYFAAHMVNDNLETAGNVAFSMSILNMIGAAFGPICLLLLPQASKAIAAGDYFNLRKNVREVFWLTIGLSALGMLLIESFTGFFVRLLVKDAGSDLIFYVRITLIACVGYAVYISLRSVLDAYYVKAVNTRNIIAAFILFVIAAGMIYYSSVAFTWMLYAFVGALSLLGALTYFETMLIFRKNQQTE